MVTFLFTCLPECTFYIECILKYPDFAYPDPFVPAIKPVDFSEAVDYFLPGWDPKSSLERQFIEIYACF